MDGRSEAEKKKPTKGENYVQVQIEDHFSTWKIEQNVKSRARTVVPFQVWNNRPSEIWFKND